MSPDPLKARPTPMLPYSNPTLCNQEAMKPKLRNRVHVFDHVTEGIPWNTLGSYGETILLHFL
jgi:hypothetical protein